MKKEEKKFKKMKTKFKKMKKNKQRMKKILKKNSPMHYPIIALMHGSHGLSARRA